MPRTQIPITTITRTGVLQATSVVAADVVNNHKVSENDGRKFVEMANVSNASSVNVTFDIPKLYDDDLTITDIIVALAPGQVKLVGPWKTGIFNQTVGSTDNAIHFDVSSTGVTFRGYRLEPA